MRILSLGWTYLEPNIGTIGAEEIDRHAFNVALERAGNVVIARAGTLPAFDPTSGGSSVDPAVVDGITLHRHTRLSPTANPWIPHTSRLSPKRIQNDAQLLQQWIDEDDPDVIIAGLGEPDGNLPHALFRTQTRAKRVHIPYTRFNHPTARHLPWDMQIYQYPTDKQWDRLQRARGQLALWRPAAHDALFHSIRPNADNGDAAVSRAFRGDVPHEWVYLPPISSTAIADHLRAIQAIGVAQRTLGPTVVAVPKPDRLANPDWAKRRYYALAREAEAANVKLRFTEPLEPTEMAAFLNRTALVMANYGSRSGIEAISLERPTIPVRDPNTNLLFSPRRIAENIVNRLDRSAPDLGAEARVAQWRTALSRHGDQPAEAVELLEQLVQSQRILLPGADMPKQLGQSLRNVVELPLRSRTLGRQLGDTQVGQYAEANIDFVVVSSIGPPDRLDLALRVARRNGSRLMVTCANEQQLTQFGQYLKLRGVDDALLVNIETFANHEINNVTNALNTHTLAANYKADISNRRKLAQILLRGHRLLFLDDDVSLEPNDKFVRLAATHVGPDESALKAVGIPVTEGEGDHSTTHHSAPLFGLDEPTAFVGAGCEVVWADDVRLFPNIYGEDWFALMDAIGEGKLGLIGAARQLPGWPLADPQRSEDEAWGDLLTNAVMEWMVKCRAEGTLHRRSWTQMKPEFLDKFRERWLVGLAQLRDEGRIERKKKPYEAAIYTAAIQASERKIDKIRKFDTNSALEYLRLYAGTSDEWASVVRYLPLANTVEQTASLLGVDMKRSGDVAEIETLPIPITYESEHVRFMSEHWYTPWLRVGNMSTFYRTLVDNMSEAFTGHIPLELVEKNRKLFNDVFAVQQQRRQQLPLENMGKNLARLPARAVFRLIAVPPTVMDHFDANLEQHVAECNIAIDNVTAFSQRRGNKNAKAILRHVVMANTIASLGMELAHQRLIQEIDFELYPINADNAHDEVRRILLHDRDGLPSTLHSAEAAVNGLELSGQALTEIFQLNPWQALNPSNLIRMIVCPTFEDDQSRLWQHENRERLLQDVLDGKWTQVREEITQADRLGLLGPRLSEQWSGDWLGHTFVGDFSFRESPSVRTLPTL